MGIPCSWGYTGYGEGSFGGCEGYSTRKTQGTYGYGRGFTLGVGLGVELEFGSSSGLAGLVLLSGGVRKVAPNIDGIVISFRKKKEKIGAGGTTKNRLGDGERRWPSFVFAVGVFFTERRQSATTYSHECCFVSRRC